MFKFRKKTSETVTAMLLDSELQAIFVTVEDEDEIVAVIIAAICAGGQASISNLVVRSIVRVPERNTAWSRLQLDNT